MRNQLVPAVLEGQHLHEQDASGAVSRFRSLCEDGGRPFDVSGQCRGARTFHGCIEFLDRRGAMFGQTLEGRVLCTHQLRERRIALLVRRPAGEEPGRPLAVACDDLGIEEQHGTVADVADLDQPLQFVASSVGVDPLRIQHGETIDLIDGQEPIDERARPAPAVCHREERSVRRRKRLAEPPFGGCDLFLRRRVAAEPALLDCLPRDLLELLSVEALQPVAAPTFQQAPPLPRSHERSMLPAPTNLARLRNGFSSETGFTPGSQCTDSTRTTPLFRSNIGSIRPTRRSPCRIGST